MSEPSDRDTDMIRGFILNKLYWHKYWVRPGGRPKKHTSIRNMPKGYAPELSGNVLGEVDSLRRMGLIMVFPHVGNGERHVCAILDPKSIEKGLDLCNKYRRYAKLPLLDKRLNEIEI